MEIKDKIKKLKYLRMKPEERFLEDIFYQLKPKISDEEQDYIFYVLNNEVLFELNTKTNYFYYDYDEIWDVLRKIYLLNLKQIERLIINVVWKHLKLKVIPTQHQHTPYDIILKDITKKNSNYEN